MNFAGEAIQINPGEGISVSGRIPEGEDFFQDHFPEFPVLPGVLALEILRKSAESYLRKMSGPAVEAVLEKVEVVKFSSYFRPGDAWESRVVITGEENGKTVWNGKLFKDGKPACSARFQLKSRKR